MAVQQVTSRLLADGSITDAKVNASAGIQYSKLNLTTSIVNSDIAAAAGIDYTKLDLTASIINADVAAGAGIVYSKLSLTDSILNADINSAAGIAYSKLDLTNGIVNGDINSSAAISYSKLDLSGNIVNADINAAAAIDYSKLSLSGQVTNTDIAAGAGISYSKLDLASSIVNADVAAGAAIAYSKLNLADSIVNTDVNTSADIETSKLSLNDDFRHPVPTEIIDFTSNVNSLVQDLSGSIGAPASTGPTVKGAVVLEADNNFVPRGVRDENSLDDITSGDLDNSLSGEQANQSVYMRLTNSYATAQPSNVTGVTVGYVEEGNTSGALNYTNSTQTLTWKSGSGVVVSAGGLFTLDDGAGNQMIVDVNAGLLPGTDQSDTINFSVGYRGAFFFRSIADGSEIPLKSTAVMPNLRLQYAQIYGIDDLPYLAFFGIGNSSDGVITPNHTHILANVTDVTTSATELNQALDGISANVTAANLNTLTGGSNADALHTHAALAPASNQIDVFSATGGQTNFTLSQTPVTDSEHLTIEGVKQAKTTHYTLSGTTLTLTSGASSGERVIVQYQY